MKGFKQHPKMSHGGHYCWGGKVMKKAEGGTVKGYRPTAREMVEFSKKRGDEGTVWAEKDGEADAEESGRIEYNNIQDKMAEKFPRSFTSVKTRAYSDRAKDFGKEGQAGMKHGGMAKGGNWIQGAIKKPGALKKSLGVPAGKTIPAGKLEKASKAPGKMGQRARLAMTLKGMK